MYTFSQKRGTALMHVGCVSRIDCCTSMGLVFTMRRAPTVMHSIFHPFSKMWVKGRKFSTRSSLVTGTHLWLASMAA